MERITTVDDYLSLKYSIKFTEEDGIFYTEVVELPGCWSEGKTPDEAFLNTKESMKLWIETALERGIKVPLPQEEEKDYSGKIVLRMPKTLHKNLSEKADKENVSLNHYLVYLLSSNFSIVNAQKTVDKSMIEKTYQFTLQKPATWEPKQQSFTGSFNEQPALYCKE